MTKLDDRLQCQVLSVTYDNRTRVGELTMVEGDNCDMQGCVDLFLALDPDVWAIRTYSGSRLDTCYRRDRSNAWRAT